MTAIAPLTTYRTARADLLAAAEAAGAVLGSHAHPGTAPDGGPLATDVARFGAPPGQADEVVLVLSGVHGVEGHAGSALQRDLIASGRLGALPDRTRWCWCTPPTPSAWRGGGGSTPPTST